MLRPSVGAKKITSLGCYPLKYHKNEEKVRKDLIERGKKFVTLSGVNYKSHQGLAYYKKKKSIVKVRPPPTLPYPLYCLCMLYTSILSLCIRSTSTAE